MADRIFFVAGTPNDAIRGFAVAQQMVDDLIQLAHLELAAVVEISDNLTAVKGFLTEPQLKTFVQESVADSAASDALVRLVKNLRPGRVKQSLVSLGSWREADPRNAERLSEDLLLTLKDYLPRLIREYPAWERYRKARRLTSITGNQASQFELICDARPVFDSERRLIEGFVPLITLKILYETQTGEACCFELNVAPDVLMRLVENGGKVEQKLKALRTAVDDWIPDGFIEPTD